MSINEATLLNKVKKIVGIQDEEWNAAGFSGGITRNLAKDILEEYVRDLCVRYKYTFLQGKYTSDNTDKTRKLNVYNDDKAIIWEDNFLEYKWGKIGEIELKIKPLGDIEALKWTDSNAIRYGYFEVIESKGLLVVRLLTALSGSVVTAVMKKVPSFKFFPKEFERMFIYMLAEELTMLKQKNNDEGARLAFLEKLNRKEEMVSQSWVEMAESETDVVHLTPYSGKTFYKSGRSTAR